ncbi:glycoside hydrolase family 3 protein [Micromonospora inositola]|uniref:hypothetical protein n=1 Tax=Micromonospora inositola TaxID=47865 RepID=UPI0018D52C22|nr:hypothetical protein [Micromonospora inositola]
MRAQEIADSPEPQAKADEAHRRSIVLMRNDRKTLPLADADVATTRLYVEVVTGNNADVQTEALKDVISETDPSVRVVDNLEDATAALVWVRPSTYEISDTEGVSVELDEKTGVDVARVKLIEATVPTILAINMVNPWVINEIEPAAAAVVATFNVKAEALVDVLRGRSPSSPVLVMGAAVLSVLAVLVTRRPATRPLPTCPPSRARTSRWRRSERSHPDEPWSADHGPSALALSVVSTDRHPSSTPVRTGRGGVGAVRVHRRRPRRQPRRAGTPHRPRQRHPAPRRR